MLEAGPLFRQVFDKIKPVIIFCVALNRDRSLQKSVAYKLGYKCDKDRKSTTKLPNRGGSAKSSGHRPSFCV